MTNRSAYNALLLLEELTSRMSLHAINQTAANVDLQHGVHQTLLPASLALAGGP